MPCSLELLIDVSTVHFQVCTMYISVSYVCLIFMVLQINGSLARRAIKDLMERGLIRMVSIQSSQQIFTRATNTATSHVNIRLYFIVEYLFVLPK